MSTDKKYEIKDKDYLELWEHYQDRADSVKESMFENTTWLVGIASAILGFIFSQFLEFKPSEIIIRQPAFGLLTSAAGTLVSVYALLMLNEFGDHIRTNWGNADYCRCRLLGMPPLPGKRKRWFLSLGKLQIWVRLELLIVCFLLVFLALSVFFFREWA
jgi:hypothetical protein